MNDQIIMENYLLVLKSTVEVYVHGTLESSNKEITNILQENLNGTLDCQSHTYNEMTKYGWYKIQNVDNSKISKVLSNIKKSN